MPRILLSTAHITPLVLTFLGVEFTPPPLVAPYPPLPEPFRVTTERVQRLQKVDPASKYDEGVKSSLESAKKSFCNDVRSRPRLS